MVSCSYVNGPEVSRHIVMPLIPPNAPNVGIAQQLVVMRVYSLLPLAPFTNPPDHVAHAFD